MSCKISKEVFCRALEYILEQEEINRQFSKSLELVGNGHFVFGSPNGYLNASLLILKEAMEDKYDYIEWWLFEPCKDRIIRLSDNSKSWDLSLPEALYDYLTQ